MKRSAIALAIALTLVACSSGRAPEPVEAEPGPLSVLYSIRDNDRDALVGVHRASVPDGRSSALRSPPFDGALWGSRDGRFILRRTPYELTSADLRSELAVASSDNLESFRTLVKVRGSYIEEVLWASDGETIFYLQSVSAENVTRHELRSIRRDGTGAPLIRRFQAQTPVDLAAVDLQRGVLYWTDEYFSDDSESDNNRTHIIAVDLSDGSAKPLDLSINPIIGPDMAFAPDGSAVYYIAGSRIIERILTTGHERVLHRAKVENAFVHSILISPDGKTLYFGEDAGSSTQPTSLYALSVGDLKAKVIYEYRGSAEGGSVRLSPDGFWMWFEYADGGPRLLDLRSLEVHPFIREPPGDDLRFDFLTWVVN